MQRLIDNNLLEDARLGTVAEPANIISSDYISLIHKHFYERLPKELQWVEDPKTTKTQKLEFGNSPILLARQTICQCLFLDLKKLMI